MEENFSALLKINRRHKGNKEEISNYLMLIYQNLKKIDLNLIDFEECFKSVFEACEVVLDDPPWDLIDDICMIFLNTYTNMYQIEEFLRVLNGKNLKYLKVTFLSLFLKISNILYIKLGNCQVQVYSDLKEKIRIYIEILIIIHLSLNLNFDIESFKRIIEIHLNDLIIYLEEKIPCIINDSELLPIIKELHLSSFQINLRLIQNDIFYLSNIKAKIINQKYLFTLSSKNTIQVIKYKNKVIKFIIHQNSISLIKNFLFQYKIVKLLSELNNQSENCFIPIKSLISFELSTSKAIGFMMKKYLNTFKSLIEEPGKNSTQLKLSDLMIVIKKRLINQ